MSKNHPGKSSATKVSKQTKRSAGRFQLLTDFKAGDKVPEKPPQFASDFRLLRQMVRWAKRYGVLLEGRLRIFVSRQDMEKNHAWRTIDLARSVVSYRNGDRKIIVNTSEQAPEIFRFKVDDEAKFKQWINQIRAHRQFGQSKLNPQRAVSTPEPPAAATEPSETVQQTARTVEIKYDDAVATLTTMSELLEKLEENVNSNHPESQDTRKLQTEFLTTARDVHSKLHSLFGIPNERQHIPKWQPTAKPKQHLPSTGSARTPEKPKPIEKATPKAVVKADPPPTPPTPQQPQTKKTTTAVQTNPPPAPKKEVPKASEVKQAVLVPSVPSSAASSAITPSGYSSPVATGHTSPPSMKTDDGEEGISPEDQQIDNVPDVDGDVSEKEERDEPSLKKGPMPVYRQKLPAVMGPQPSVFRIAMAAIGRDVMQFSLPAAIMEPLSMLQIMCEELEYSELIDQAVAQTEPYMRMAYVACFACSRYGSTAFRSGRKPFNPLLGQSFEYHSPHLGWRFVGEQVQHHPSVSAGCAEGRGWTWWQDCELKVTYGGNSMEVKPVGVVYLCLEKYKETYKWIKPLTSVSGLLSGTYVLDHYGELVIQCERSGIVGRMHFNRTAKEKRGEIDGKVLDGNGKVLQIVYGAWNDSLYVGPPGDASRAQCVWRLAALPPDSAKYYGLTRFALSLNEIRPDVHGCLPKTDGRYRPDQKALEMGKADVADKIKKDLEDKQRKRRQEVEAGKRKAPKPLWFQPTANKDPTKGARWQFNGRYWEAKKKEFEGIHFLPLW